MKREYAVRRSTPEEVVSPETSPSGGASEERNVIRRCLNYGNAASPCNRNGIRRRVLDGNAGPSTHHLGRDVNTG